MKVISTIFNITSIMVKVCDMERIPSLLYYPVIDYLLTCYYTAIVGENKKMMYRSITLDDNAEIVHSEMKEDGTVKVYVEKPDTKDCFHHMTCILPSYSIEEVFGFSEEEIARYMDVIKSTSNLILEFSKHGGFENASGF